MTEGINDDVTDKVLKPSPIAPRGAIGPDQLETTL